MAVVEWPQESGRALFLGRRDYRYDRLKRAAACTGLEFALFESLTGIIIH